MSVTINAKGTSVPYFTVGKNGTTIYQGGTDPSLVYTIKNGDYWLDSADNSIKVWGSSAWNAPKIADLHFIASTIVAPTGTDITLSVDPSKSVVVDAGTSGPALITATNSQDLHINPAYGGGQYLVLCADRWPAADGTAAGQTLVTDGAGTLNWSSLMLNGTTISAPATDDIILSTSGVNTKIQFAGDVGPGIITASASQDLYIDPTLGGGGNLILIANQWPTADGSANQVLTTNGSGVLSFTTINRVGSPSPATTATTGFAYIPVTTGTPTGTPTAISGYAPMVADSGGDKLWVYIGGAWKSATLS